MTSRGYGALFGTSKQTDVPTGSRGVAVCCIDSSFEARYGYTEPVFGAGMHGAITVGAV